MTAVAEPVSPERVERERPLGSYAALITTFSTIVGGAIAVAAARGKRPERPSLTDIALVGIAAHKVSRLVAMDKVTAPIRAPFTVTTADEEGELVDRATGRGFNRAVGQLLTCPKCVGQWASATLVVGLVYQPRPTRIVASVFASDAISDFLHVAYRAASDRA